MKKFKTKIGGYDRKEVDAYLHKTTEYQESKIRELEDCIKRLKEENDYLYAKNSEYHRNEERVSGAILKAMQIKNDLEEDLRKKIELEEDRLRIFKEKWLEFARGCDCAHAENALRNAEEYLRDFRERFSKEAMRDLGLEESRISPADRSYLSEQARLLNLSESREENEKMSAASLLGGVNRKEIEKAPFGFCED